MSFPLTCLWRLAAAAHPSRRVHAAGHTATKRGMRPLRRVRDQTVLHRVEMNVIHMRREVPVVADRVLPVSPLPDTAFAPARHDRRSRLADAYGFRKPFLDRAPTAGEIGIALRQGPQAVHMIGKHDPGVDVEWRAGADLPNHIPQRVDLCDQQVRPAVEQVRREEERSARNPIATIIWHGGIMPGVGERRKALRFSALRVLRQNYRIAIFASYGAASGRSGMGRAVAPGRNILLLISCESSGRCSILRRQVCFGAMQAVDGSREEVARPCRREGRLRGHAVGEGLT
jgi:hypothetical protein